jgi:hypothetical protein
MEKEEPPPRRQSHSNPQPYLRAYSVHYRKHINFCGPEYFRRSAHENTAVIFVGLLTDEHMEYFHRPRTRSTKITTIFVALSQAHENKAIGPPKSPPPVARFEYPLSVPHRAATRPSPRHRPHVSPLTAPPPARPPSEAPHPPLAAPPPRPRHPALCREGLPTPCRSLHARRRGAPRRGRAVPPRRSEASRSQ